MTWLMRFLFSQVVVLDRYIELRLHGSSWKTIQLETVDGLGEVGIFGLRVLHFHTTKGEQFNLLGQLGRFRESLRSLLLQTVELALTKTTAQIRNRYPTNAVLDTAWKHCHQELKQEMALLRASWVLELMGDAPELAKLLKLWSALEGDSGERCLLVESHIKAELDQFRGFFDRIEKVPLTEEQRRACVVCDDRQLLIAAAGSGKSSTIVSKIGYLLNRGWAKPEQILALAFNKDAATELKARCESRLAPIADHDKIQVKTFHSFGYDLIGRRRGKKPRLSPSAGDDRSRLRLIRSLVQEAMASSETLAVSYRILQTYLVGPEESLLEVMTGSPCPPLTTLRGEKVKSHQEVLIANFLYLHGVPYEYERPFEHDVADATHGQYQPDFYYPTIQTYHEHFAIDSHGNAPSDFQGYMEKVEWRRQTQARFGTKFFETKSADFENKTIYDKLMFFLKEHGYDFASMSGPGPALGEVEIKDRITETLDRFIANRKLTGIDPDELRKKAWGKGAWIADSLPLAEAVAIRYDEHLQGRQEIDFTDMLLEAAKVCQQDPVDLGIRYLLVDEYQDMSAARLELVQGVLRNNPGCKLFAVGDDWQSINGFAGSELRIMTEFESIFGPSTIQQLTATFRSNQGIANVASQFIMANPAQLKKEIHAADPTSDGVIEVHLFNNPVDPSSVAPAIKESLLLAPGGQRNGNAFVLSRYNSFLHPNNPTKLEWGFLNLTKQIQTVTHEAVDLKSTTFHGSKGLEADVVVLLGLVERNLNQRCFPSRAQEDDLVRLPLPDPESFPDAEERRLMYVALTRARHKVVIPVPISGRSKFVSELFSFPKHVAVYQQGQRLAACPFCNQGFFLRKRDTWFECTNSRCSFGDGSLNHDCPECSTGTLVVKVGQHGYFVGCNKYPDCSHIDKTRSPKLRHLERPFRAKVDRLVPTVQIPQRRFTGGELEGVDLPGGHGPVLGMKE